MIQCFVALLRHLGYAFQIEIPERGQYTRFLVGDLDQSGGTAVLHQQVAEHTQYEDNEGFLFLTALFHNFAKELLHMSVIDFRRRTLLRKSQCAA